MPKQLERDLAIEVRVPGAVDLAEAAPAPPARAGAGGPTSRAGRRGWVRGRDVVAADDARGADRRWSAVTSCEDAQLPQHDLVVRTGRGLDGRPVDGRALENRRRDAGRAASLYPRPISSASLTSARRAASPRRIRRSPGRWPRRPARACSRAPRVATISSRSVSLRRPAPLRTAPPPRVRPPVRAATGSGLRAASRVRSRTGRRPTRRM